jgi:hypothetical protein
MERNACNGKNPTAFKFGVLTSVVLLLLLML